MLTFVHWTEIVLTNNRKIASHKKIQFEPFNTNTIQNAQNKQFKLKIVSYRQMSLWK